MSQSLTVVGGVNGHHVSGTLTIPIAQGLPVASLNQLQLDLAATGFGVLNGQTQLTNLDVAGKTGSVQVPAPTSGGALLELSNLSVAGSGHGRSPGESEWSGPEGWLRFWEHREHPHRPYGNHSPGGSHTTSGQADISATVPAGYSNVIVQAPGSVTLTGNGQTGENYLFGASSNVALNTDGGSGSIVAGGGADSLNLSGNYAVSMVGGSDAVTLSGGSDTINAYGSAGATIGASSGTSTALNFINHGSAQAFINAGGGTMTVFGGDGGGRFIGGTEGGNSLIGGAGKVTMVGAGTGDVLEAGMSTGGATVAGTNDLLAGSGNETLIASSLTGSNLLVAGSGSDSIATDGSGLQQIYGGSGTSTITGSTIAGATNLYMVGAASASGGTDIITDFRVGHDMLGALNGATITSVTSGSFGGMTGAIVSLSDGTTVKLANVDAASISGSIGQSGII